VAACPTAAAPGHRIPENWSWQPTVATKIKLMRLGKMRAPYYRIVVADARTRRNGRVIETIGKYHPKEEPSFIEVDTDRAQYWLGVGAQPTEPVAAILKLTGDWQKFRGEPAPPPLKVAEPKPDKAEIFGEASRAAAGLSDSSGGPATQPKKKKASEKAEPTPDAPGAAPEQPAVATPASE
jgi:small subunit ribosomal protein S16